MYRNTPKQTLEILGSDAANGLDRVQVEKSRARYGSNRLTRVKGKSVLRRVIDALCDPMLIILAVALTVTFGINLGKLLKGGDGDFTECIGVLVAILLSCIITVIMEGRSAKAFEMLNTITDRVSVAVLREGRHTLIGKEELVVGDIVFISVGDKLPADGRLLEAEELRVDESMLTGESNQIKKVAETSFNSEIPLGERINCVYSGTLVTSGSGVMVVTAVGDGAEIGKIASAVQAQSKVSSPLNEKLARLGKTITIIGAISAAVVFALSVVRLIMSGGFCFESLQEIIVNCIVLVVAAVPEGLPTIVAVSLSLNVVKLAGENALVKKLVAAETAGCVSVICTDKTGTLTKNKMTVEQFCCGDNCRSELFSVKDSIYENIVINSTAEAVSNGEKQLFVGNPTECALLEAYAKTHRRNYAELRRAADKLYVKPFASEHKYMLTTVKDGNGKMTYIKGAPERILGFCALTDARRLAVEQRMRVFQNQAKRLIAFCHSESENPTLNAVFDGFAVISDPVRSDVLRSVELCREAGIDVKMLTGDNAKTAYAIARELGLANIQTQVVNAPDIDGYSDEQLKKLLPKVSVIARSTPLVKLRVVKLLKEMGEVVAVTGDGINDAPALKQADIGIAMGSGAEIAKETGSVVLLDDSFSTIVKAIAFGRGVYRNFQRFILFQLSVNLSAVFSVVIALILGLRVPFTSMQLLWLNLIMDGPPALSLGLEQPSAELMRLKPIKRSDNIVTKKLLARILLHSGYITALVVCQLKYNYLGANALESGAAVFTLFVMLQVFNAFNCREMGRVSIFKQLGKNKAMLCVFALTFVLQIVITQFGGKVFSTSPLSAALWIKILAAAFSIILISEIYKAIYGFPPIQKMLNNR